MFLRKSSSFEPAVDQNHVFAQSLLRTKDERASRVRENKRQHRICQKEYVLDLERRVALAQEQGVQATREMQLAAQRVASENAKIRELLRQAGCSDKTIEARLSEQGCSGNGKLCQAQIKSGPGQTLRKPASARKLQTTSTKDAHASIDPAEPSLKTSASRNWSQMPKHPPSNVEPGSVDGKSSPLKTCSSTCKKDSPLSQSRDSATTPCRILASLAEDPAADITQVPLPLLSERQSDNKAECEPDGGDGIECPTAYRTLLQYATSPGKTDRIALALEQGCTPSGAGGCKVKGSVMWKVLDEEC